MMKNSTRSGLKMGAVLAGLLLVGFGCLPSTKVTTNANLGVSVEKRPRQLEVDLQAQSASGISGKALLTEQGNTTKVTLDVSGSLPGEAHPAHIHVGSCPTPGAVKYPLIDVRDGRSETVVDASFDEIMAGLPLAINLHRSAAEISLYVACGDLDAAAVQE